MKDWATRVRRIAVRTLRTTCATDVEPTHLIQPYCSLGSASTEAMAQRTPCASGEFVRGINTTECKREGAMMNEALRRKQLSQFGETVVFEQLEKNGYRCTFIGVNSPYFDIEAYNKSKHKFLVQVKTRNHTFATGEIKTDTYGSPVRDVPRFGQHGPDR
jgi:hypothetical protein